MYIRVHVPEYLQTCSPIPQSPAANPDAKQSDVAEYVVGLHEVATECRGKLYAVNRIIAKAQ